MERRCCECRKGEHENLDDNLKKVEVRNPDTRGFVLRGWVCGEHREAFESDGYEISPIA